MEFYIELPVFNSASEVKLMYFKDVEEDYRP